MKKDVIKDNENLFAEIKQIIDNSRQTAAQAVNVTLTSMYWNIGKRINENILNNKRAQYGKQSISALGKQLENDYGSSFSDKNLRRMMQFNEAFPDFTIVATLWRQLSWSHFKLFIPLKSKL